MPLLPMKGKPMVIIQFVLNVQQWIFDNSFLCYPHDTDTLPAMSCQILTAAFW